MCGHGTIGVVATLAYLNRIGPGTHRIETPVGIVTAQTLRKWRRRDRKRAELSPGSQRSRSTCRALDQSRGDVAWGGNWFFLVNDHGRQLTLDNLETLTDFTWRIRESLAREGITGADGHEIDHVELFAPSRTQRRGQQEFCVVPRQGLRPFAVRHRHEREAGVSVCRRQARRRRSLAAGKHRRQRFRRNVCR